MKNKLSGSAERKAGALLSYAQVFLNVIVGLLYTPVMLRLMGQNEYAPSVASCTICMSY